MEKGNTKMTLERDLIAHLPLGMKVPDSLLQFYRWIQANGWLTIDDDYIEGYIPEMLECSGLRFRALNSVDLQQDGYFSLCPNLFSQRLCIFASVKGDVNDVPLALWMDDQGDVKVVILHCYDKPYRVLSDSVDDFLRLIALNYNTLCWHGEMWGDPTEERVYNGILFPVDERCTKPVSYREWLSEGMQMSLPTSGEDLLPQYSYNAFDRKDTTDPFTLWLTANAS